MIKSIRGSDRMRLCIIWPGCWKGLGAAGGSVLGNKVGGSTGSTIGAGLGACNRWRWPMNTPAAANVIAAITTAKKHNTLLQESEHEAFRVVPA